MTSKNNEELKIIRAIERAEANGDYEKASELTRELIDIQTTSK